MSAMIVTSLGNILMDLYTDRCPLTCKNFLKLCKFLYGDQAHFFGDEIHLDVKHSKTGTVSMASAGENLNASQVFGEVVEDPHQLAEFIPEASPEGKSKDEEEVSSNVVLLITLLKTALWIPPSSSNI
ncbi:unnamed protein product [Fraxinus pennsylvanica]|uniref:PPIase cyclophilin-type domain-containing protein n=1 Tax=Fraxinus pennsylvanica TaxID=56036 RepID=A0AAD1Z316_9LAMI|nr:unnamed protein product [Fraxinus pennsylvanica]